MSMYRRRLLHFNVSTTVNLLDQKTLFHEGIRNYEKTFDSGHFLECDVMESIGHILEAFEMLATIYQITWHHIPQKITVLIFTTVRTSYHMEVNTSTKEVHVCSIST
jgi:hypothetical protein